MILQIFPFRFLPLFWIIFIILIVIISFIVQVAIGVWVYRDAKKRRMEAAIWLLIVLITGLIGLIIYFIIRDPKPLEPSPRTDYVQPPKYSLEGTIMEKDIKFCSNCGIKMPSSDKFCSQCGNKT